MRSHTKGYSITLADKEKNILEVQAWGIWDVEDTPLAEGFDKDLKEKVKEVSADGKEWSVCGDLAKFSPQSKEVCRIIRDGITFAVKHGMNKGMHPGHACPKTRR